DELTSSAGAPGESPAYLWARFATAAARAKPLCLVLEDVQLDPDVAAIALRAAERSRRKRAPLVVMLTARPEVAEGDGAQMGARGDRGRSLDGVARADTRPAAAGRARAALGARCRASGGTPARGEAFRGGRIGARRRVRDRTPARRPARSAGLRGVAPAARGG